MSPKRSSKRNKGTRPTVVDSRRRRTDAIESGSDNTDDDESTPLTKVDGNNKERCSTTATVKGGGGRRSSRRGTTCDPSTDDSHPSTDNGDGQKSTSRQQSSDGQNQATSQHVSATSSGRKNGGQYSPGWECTVCTYKNRTEAFKCEMCDTRKGTSTRKPKLNANMIDQQLVMHDFVVNQQLNSLHGSGQPQHGLSLHRKHSSSPKRKNKERRLGMAMTKWSQVANSNNQRGGAVSSVSSPTSTSSRSRRNQQLDNNNFRQRQETRDADGCSGRHRDNSSSTLKRHYLFSADDGDDRKMLRGAFRNMKGFDKNSARTIAITVHGLTVVVTDYEMAQQPSPPLPPPTKRARNSAIVSTTKMASDVTPKVLSSDYDDSPL